MPCEITLGAGALIGSERLDHDLTLFANDKTALSRSIPTWKLQEFGSERDPLWLAQAVKGQRETPNPQREVSCPHLRLNRR
jgi:hypothetical protein